MTIYEEINKALKLLANFQAANVNIPNQIDPLLQKWTPPNIGWIKVNTDASLSSSSLGQVGVILRDHRDSVIVTAIQQYPMISHPTLLVALGILYGVDIAISMGFQKVALESECQPVVKAI